MTVFYDPDDPATSVLHPGVGVEAILPLVVGSIFLGSGLAVLLRGRAMARRARQEENSLAPPAS